MTSPACESHAHSRFGGSKAKLWVNCPGALALIDRLPKEEAGPWADEGTAAHALGEWALLNRKADPAQWLGQPVKAFLPETKAGAADYIVDRDMVDSALLYRETVETYLDRESAVLRVEQRFALPEIHPDCFGTADAIVELPYDTLVVIDLKYGRGVMVEAEDNMQLKFYALGAARVSDYEFSHVTLVIVQPRGYDGEPVKTYTFTMVELEEFAATLREAAAASLLPDAPLRPGTHCKEGFCPAYAHCPAVRKEALALLDDLPTLTPAVSGEVILSPEELGVILDKGAMLEGYLTTLRKLAFDILKSGGKIPGHKLVEKRAIRKWADEMMAISVLSESLGDTIWEEPKLKSPAAIEKLGKNAKALLKDDAFGLTIKVSSGLTMAGADDPRPEVDPRKSIDLLDDLSEKI